MTTFSTPDRRVPSLLFVAGVAVFAGAAWLIRWPGYMDAEYYMATGRSLAQGSGFQESFLWNYLADPEGIPAPSHTYWQPLASLVAAVPMTLLGATFRSAQLSSVLLAAALPPLSAILAATLGADRRAVWLAGLFALLPGFFLPYLVTTDTFGPFAVIGGLLWWQLADPHRSGTVRWVFLGALVGLGHLARADGALLGVPVAWAAMTGSSRRGGRLLAAIAGYAMTMSPWWGRTLAATGTLLGPGAARSLWLLEYDELFSYPASVLTAARWWQAGVSTLIAHRVASGWAQIQTLIAVNGSVVLFPLVLLGARRRSSHPAVRAAGLYAVLLLVVMTLVFPFAGARGGFFHSSAALMPLVWALAPIGLEAAGSSLARRLAWDPARTGRMLASVSVLVAGGLSAWILAGKAGALGPEGSFVRNQIVYTAAGEALSEAPTGARTVAVIDPPGFFLATGLPAVAVPNGTEATLREVVQRYRVSWVVLEADHPAGLGDLYRNPEEPGWLGSPLAFVDVNGAPVYLLPVEDE